MSQALKSKLASTLADVLLDCELVGGEVTIYVAAEQIITVCKTLRDEFGFEQLMDLCGVDYSTYGGSAWLTKTATDQGFSRAVDASKNTESVDDGYRYAVVYHLLSLQHNQRLRVKVRLDADSPIIDSVTAIWESAGWFEREAFDLFGILFDGHQDLRRILTDYGFIGHPFRKDFPLIGNVEMRYDADKKRVVYEPVSIQERILVPRVIRDDNRYEKGQS
ncbi:MAG: NADH-quinone oxidoreductase subunit C [Piscirickettsiaceae bacterium]|jgi:NADH-quinone oxidoreductase subunit C|nr:NADH-quinone oxidoreductase subunit C [Piscirickettsiaceae bacterium]